MTPVILWFLLGVAFFLTELFAPAFVVLFFGLGAWVAAILAAVHHHLVAEIVLFIVASLASLALLRRRVMKVFRGRSTPGAADGFISSLVGKSGVVTRAIAPGSTGEVELGGSFWRAVAEVAIPERAGVKVVGHLEGDELTLRVRPEIEPS